MHVVRINYRWASNQRLLIDFFIFFSLLEFIPGFTRREIMERCVDSFEDYVREWRREGPEHHKTRDHALGTLLKPLGYLSSGARVRFRKRDKFSIKFISKIFCCLRQLVAGIVRQNICGVRCHLSAVGKHITASMLPWLDMSISAPGVPNK